MRGKFITFEGCDGCGKSTQLKLLSEYLQAQNIEHVFTREPGGSKIAEQIREILLNGKNAEMTDECEALLYAAARVQHLHDKVEPALSQGKLVICDRYVDSSLAYQGYARGLGVDFVEKINDFAIKNFMPDYTLFLNLPPEQAFKRKGGVDKTDRLELSGIEFHDKVYNGYLSLAQKYQNRFIVIDASGEKEQTHQKIIDALKQKGVI
jgi:dTMP kinase